MNLNIASDGAVLAAEVHGSGPQTLIFLHASICDRRMWAQQVEALSSSYQTVCYDRRGFGDSQTISDNDYSAVGDLIRVIDAVAPEQTVVLVGCSQGGRIALDAVLMYPERIAGLVLIAPSISGSPAPNYSDDMAPLMQQLKEATQSKNFDLQNRLQVRLFLDGALAPENRISGDTRELVLAMNKLALSSATRGANLDCSNAFSRLKEINVPCQVVWGNLDFPHIQTRSQYIAEQASKGSQHVVTTTAHFPNLEQAAVVTCLISKFVSELPDAGVAFGS